jgi:uncharacterized protein (AIM24 family)
MQIEILYRPSYSVARVLLDRKEKIQVESGAMVGMSPDMEMETEAKGGFLKSISRSMFGGESFFMNTYLASTEGVTVDTKWSGAKTFFGSEGLIMLKVSGTGTLIVSSYGAIHPMELEAGRKYVVDTGHLVTFDEKIGFNVKKVAGWKSTLFSGEGLVVELTGPGKLNLQSRSQDSFLSWLIPRIPKQTTYVSSGN